MLRAALLIAVSTLATLLVAGAGPASRSAVSPRPLFVLRNPIDPRQQTRIAFGQRSHWLQPWRAYLDTVPATRLLDAVGIAFDVPAAQARATAQLLARAGFRRARIEVGWGSFSYSQPDRLKHPGALRAVLLALERVHIRPLILLNANDLEPCPIRSFQATLDDPAERGALSVHVDAATAAAIVPGRSGLTLPAGGKAAGILFTSVKDGIATLSKPLPERLAAGSHAAVTLLYEPFARPRLADGGRNPRFERTLAGWLRYVQSVARFARATLGSTRFDLEIWNELSFGSDFLDIDSYYSHPVDEGAGDTTDAILRSTVAWLRRPGSGFASVGIGDGFASQRPWDSGTDSPVGLTAIVKHPYPPLRVLPRDAVFGQERAIDALGKVSARRVGGRWIDRFVPRYTAFLPEYALTAIQTETLVRDLSPYTTRVYGVPHGRYTHPPGGRPPQVWVTEWNLDPGDALGADEAGPLTPIERHLQAKAALRALVAYVNKGVGAFFYYAALDTRLGLIDPHAPGGGETIGAIARLLDGFAGAEQLRRTRPLKLLRIGDFANRVQFAGDGTPAHPPLYDRDVLAFLPFQVTAGRYVIAAYVMTRDIARRYRPSSRRPGGAFDLPPETFRLVISGLGRCDLRVSMTDPLLGGQQPLRKVACSRSALTVDVPLTDSPRLLRIGWLHAASRSTISRSRPQKRASEKASACARRTVSSHERREHVRRARRIDSGEGGSKNTPVTPSTTVSRKPPARNTTAGFPNAAASRGVKPKSSCDAATTAAQWA